MEIKVGFIGLGMMGKPMAMNLIRVGYHLSVYARRAESMQPLIAAGAAPCSSAMEVAARTQVTFIMVGDTRNVEQVVIGDSGCIHGSRAGSVIVDMSTISPIATRAMANQLALKNVEMLDAPVCGDPSSATGATLLIMVGGNLATFERVRPLFENLGNNVVYMGSSGAGQVANACNQSVIAVSIEAVAEALTLARKSGVEMAKVREALLGGFAYSRVLEIHGKRMLERDFSPGYTAKLHQKDMHIVLDLARELGLALPAAALSAQHLNALLGSGCGELDSSAVVKVIEAMSGLATNKQTGTGLVQ